MLNIERKIVLNSFVNVMVLVYYMHSSYWMFTVIFLTWNVLSNLPYCVKKKKILLDLPESQILLPSIWVMKVCKMCIPVVNLTAVSQLPQDLHPLVNCKTQRNRSVFIQIMQVSLPTDAQLFSSLWNKLYVVSVQKSAQWFHKKSSNGRYVKRGGEMRAGQTALLTKEPGTPALDFSLLDCSSLTLLVLP